MHVAIGRPEDTEAIVELLKNSLGESLMPKSSNYWNWKHINNPFGKSPVLLSWDGTKLVGVRAFMRWNWQLADKIYTSVRAVDTATHPNYQGKGIFKKLTLALVDECTAAGVDFVFNTPNGQSKPGYLKMGWKEAGNLPIIVGLPALIPELSRSGGNVSDVKRLLSHPGLEKLIEIHVKKADKIITSLSPQYLRWRYLDVPVASYHAIGVEENENLVALALFRLKAGRFGNELRITDSFTMDRRAANKLGRELKKFERNLKARFITQSGLKASDGHQLRRILDIEIPRGPSVTVRSLALSDLSDLVNFNNWSPSLGDLELF
ncbi:GNAT family N-acetyltransferase [Chryseolinea sp. T2]|uniref:GNAT family N-acetyltransferase n=1 Tax=Chryseolinea sp. T2 TaxID=3129255 RepID=UPI0030774458